MFGKLLGPATFDERRSSRGQGQSPQVDLIATSVSILPDGTPLSGAVVYARAKDCGFDVTDPVLYRGNTNDLRARPRVSFELVDGRAIDVQLVQ